MPRSVVPTGRLRRCRPAMGSFVEIAIYESQSETDDAARLDAVAAAFDAIDRVASLMSFHAIDSDLSRINRSAFEGPVRVHAWTYDVLSQARELFVATGGHFDCTVGASLVERALLPAGTGYAVADIAAAAGCFDDVRLVDGEAVAFDKPLCIDLGGIAKGYAVDRAVDALKAGGIASALVNAGGDLRILGPIALPIHVRVDAPHPAIVEAGSLADGAFATSSCFRATSEGPAQSPSALIHPASRRRVDGHATYSIVAPTCTHADALTKALASTGGLPAAVLDRFQAVQMIH